MPLRKYLPTREQLRETKSLQFLGEMIFEPNLWHFNRHSVSNAALIGLFCCFLPIPFQMIPCVLLCVLARCNVPLAIVFVWTSNPVTMPPMMYFAYKVGNALLGQSSQVVSIDLSLTWLTAQLAVVWQPLLLGSLVCGIVSGIVGFIVVRLYWRWRVSRQWKKSRARVNIGD